MRERAFDFSTRAPRFAHSGFRLARQRHAPITFFARPTSSPGDDYRGHQRLGDKRPSILYCHNIGTRKEIRGLDFCVTTAVGEVQVQRAEGALTCRTATTIYGLR